MALNIISTAIAASKIAITLVMTLIPTVPNLFIILLAKLKNNEIKDYFGVGMTLAEVEKGYIQKTLEAYPAKSTCAKILGISRKSLYNKIERYGL